MAHTAPDVCDGTSAVGESRHRIPRRTRWSTDSATRKSYIVATWSCDMPNPHPVTAGNVQWRLAMRRAGFKKGWTKLQSHHALPRVANAGAGATRPVASSKHENFGGGLCIR